MRQEKRGSRRVRAAAGNLVAAMLPGVTDTVAAGRGGSPWRRRGALLSVILLTSACALAVADRVFPFPLERLRPSTSVLVRDVHGTPLRLFLAADDRYRLPVTLDQVSPTLVRAVVASEDRWFWWHPGVNPGAALRAAVANLRAGEVVSGASTLSMQVARLIEPRPRTLGSKLVEAFRALQLEWHLDKEQVLEAWFNLTPYGGNVEGVGAASLLWFGKDPGALSLGEAALFTLLPRGPVAYDPGRHPRDSTRAWRRVLERLEDEGVFDASEVANARRLELPTTPRPLPRRALHFSEAARRLATGTELRTTLDSRVQALAELAVQGRIDELRRAGIQSAAVVVIENRSRALRAMVGSPDFFDADRQGQVNVTLAPRSPGSALKPFLYALAMDRGELVPESWLLDVPTDFGGYVAENYDGAYRGRVTARQALEDSLNAPAVRLLSRVGLTPFVELLRRGGLETLDRPALHYGLPLVLGAGEVRLIDLANLYATVAEGGVHRPVRWLPSPPDSRVAEGDRLLSREASWLLTDILTGVRRPDLPAAWSLAADVPAVAWKTGTSYGHRDAWAVGFSSEHTVGVWVGNVDGRPQKGISGAEHAGPLLFDLFRSVDAAGARLSRPRGLEIDGAVVCAVSRHRPGPFCPRTRTVEVIRGRSRLPECRAHRRIFVDATTGERLVGDCLAERPPAPRLLTVHPPELVAWWRASGQAVPAAPTLSPACRDVVAADPPRVLSPDGVTPYQIRAGTGPDHQQIPLRARVGAEVRRLWWYQGGELVASGGPAEQLFVAPTVGEHELVVVDDRGRSDRIVYTVR